MAQRFGFLLVIFTLINIQAQILRLEKVDAKNHVKLTKLFFRTQIFRTQTNHTYKGESPE